MAHEKSFVGALHWSAMFIAHVRLFDKRLVRSDSSLRTRQETFLMTVSYKHSARNGASLYIGATSIMNDPNQPLNVICFATFFKGGDFMRQCKAEGCNVTLVTKEKVLHEDWPREAIDEVFALPNDAPVELFLDLVAHIAKTNQPDRIVALEEFDVVVAALAREHLCLHGMSSSNAKAFRDKYAMAVRARDAGLTVPEFVPAINNDQIRDYLNRVPAPWVLKPRSDVSAIGIRKLEDAEEVWAAIDELNHREILRERASYQVLAKFIAGEVFHVDSLVSDGRVAFAGVNKYGRPPLQVAHGGGAYISQTIPYDSPDRKKLVEINRRLIKAMSMKSGAT